MNIQEARQELQENADILNKKIDALVSSCQGLSSFEEKRKIFAQTEPLNIPSPSGNPFSQEYRDYVFEVYSFISRRHYKPENEYGIDPPVTENAINDMFIRPFPFSTRDPELIGKEMRYYAHILERLLTPGCDIVLEMGANNGSLYELLLDTGLDAYAVEINPCQAEALKRRAKLHGRAEDHVIQGEFSQFIKFNKVFDAIIFKSCIHHCADPEALLISINKQLSEHGKIIFSQEPIIANFQLPWGIRNDAETIYVTREYGWLELGFDEEFWLDMLLRCGYVARQDNPGDLIEHTAFSWRAGYDPRIIRLPKQYAKFLYPVDRAGQPRNLVGGVSALPVPINCSTIRLTAYSYKPQKLSVSLFAGAESIRHDFEPALPTEITIKHNGLGKIIIDSEKWIPHHFFGNGDRRELGIGIENLSFEY